MGLNLYDYCLPVDHEQRKWIIHTLMEHSVPINPITYKFIDTEECYEPTPYLIYNDNLEVTDQHIGMINFYETYFGTRELTPEEFVNKAIRNIQPVKKVIKYGKIIFPFP